MNASTIQGEWNIIKGTIKSKWAKFNDNDLEELQGDLNILEGKLQKIYGYSKEEAKNRFEEFKTSLSGAAADIKKDLKIIQSKL